jgi:hypothetical protein
MKYSQHFLSKNANEPLQGLEKAKCPGPELVVERLELDIVSFTFSG